MNNPIKRQGQSGATPFVLVIGLILLAAFASSGGDKPAAGKVAPKVDAPITALAPPTEAEHAFGVTLLFIYSLECEQLPLQMLGSVAGDALKVPKAEAMRYEETIHDALVAMGRPAFCARTKQYIADDWARAEALVRAEDAAKK
jgi:hypothetical protein